jgi:hypothetical protein
MFVPKEMRLNRFTDVYIEKNRNFFAQVGYSRPPQPIEEKDDDEVIPASPTKVQQLAIGERLHRKMIADQAEKRRKEAEHQQQQQQEHQEPQQQQQQEPPQ